MKDETKRIFRIISQDLDYPIYKIKMLMAALILAILALLGNFKIGLYYCLAAAIYLNYRLLRDIKNTRKNLNHFIDKTETTFE